MNKNKIHSSDNQDNKILGSQILNLVLTILVPPKITGISRNQTVTEGYSELHLNCSATGDPVLNITWTRLFDSSVVTMPLMNIRRQDGGGYRCTANNGIGRPAFKDVFINVQCEYFHCFQLLCKSDNLLENQN